MGRFVGWIPTITGRLSFSRIGDGGENSRALVANQTENPGAYLAAFQRRDSKDAPLSRSTQRRSGRHSGVYCYAYLEVSFQELPVPKDGLPIPEMVKDTHGALTGWVFLLSVDESAAVKLERQVVEGALYDSQTSGARVPRGRGSYPDERAKVSRAFFSLTSAAAARDRSEAVHRPAFALIHATVDRTGKCVLQAAPELQSTNPEGAPGLKADSLPRHAFNFLRDLAHRHYHHEASADSMTTVFAADDGDDDTWRRETHYGLVRMAIGSRRRDDLERYKRALGVVAYAEAFQRHLAAWHFEDGVLQAREEYFPYDFDALRSSMQASLMALEYRQDRRRESVTYVFVTALTSIGLVLASGQINKFSGDLTEAIPLNPFSTNTFWAAVGWAVNYPGWVILTPTIMAALLFWIARFRPIHMRAMEGRLRRFVRAAVAGMPMFWARSVAVAVPSFILVLSLLGAYLSGAYFLSRVLP